MDTKKKSEGSLISEAFYSSLPKEKPRWLSITNIVGWVIGLISVAVSFYLSNVTTINISSIETLLYPFVLLTVLTLIFLSRRRRVRYYDIIPHLHYASHSIRDFSFDEDHSPANEKAYLQNLANSAATAFSLISRSKCSVSIKICRNNEEKVQYLLEDVISNKIGTRSLEGDMFSINDFSSTQYFYENQFVPRYFSSPDIQDEYRNNVYWHPFLEKNPPKKWHPLTKSYSDWPLRYRCTLVFPIRSINSQETYDIAGFFCIDSNKKNAFSLSSDVDIGGVFADLSAIILNR